MGCVMSRVDDEDRVQKYKERKRAMKQLLGFRKEFASAILAYLKALKDTGITLRQFTESESLELETKFPPSPPLPLPPAPPLPPPIDSPDSRNFEGERNGKEVQEEIIEAGEKSNCAPPPPPSSWDIWNILDSSSPQHKVESLSVEDVDDENWAETRSRFEEDDQEPASSNKPSEALKIKSPEVDVGLSMVLRPTKDMVNREMAVWRRRRKTLAGIVKELDDYFLKASAGGKEIAILVDMGTWNSSQHHDSKEKKGSTSATLSALSWRLSSRSLQVTRDASENVTPVDPCKPGAHCITLRKIFAEEQTLYMAVREEEMVKLEHKRKSGSLQKLEIDNGDLNKIEKLRSAIENMQSDIVRLQELVKKTSASILTTINEELHPQLGALLNGLIHMWRTMYECHNFQCHISQQVHNLVSQNTESSTNNNREAALQLEGGVSFWYNSFCRLTKSQRDYVEAMCRWIKLTDPVVDSGNQNCCLSMVRTLCEKWWLALDRLPEKVVAEAIKEFLLVIRSIIGQQEQERHLKKKADRLEQRFQKELKSLIELEKKLEASGLSPKHPLSAKREKTDTLRKLHENEIAKYLSSMELNRAATLNNLQKSLPRVFEALMDYSNACTEAFEAALNLADQVCNAEQSQAEC